MPVSAPYCLRVLGTLGVYTANESSPSSLITQPRPLALLCYLLLSRPRGAHSRSALMQLLWSGRPTPVARRALRNALYTVRVALGPDAVVSIGERLIGINPRVVSCDALEAEVSAATGSTPIKHDEISPMFEFQVDDAAPFNTWMEAERTRITSLFARTSPSVAPARRELPLAGRSPTPDPYTLYLRGHYLFLRAAHGGAPAELERSREFFERALAQDPHFALAVAGLANYYAVAARRGALGDFRRTFGRTIELSHRAAELDSSLAIPHVHFAVRAMYLDDDWLRAGKEFALAIRKEPDYAEGHRFYGVWLGIDGQHANALGHMEIAAQLEPDIPHMWSSLGAARAAMGDVDGAMQALRTTLTLDSRHQPARERIIRLFEDAERFEEALAERVSAPVSIANGRYADGWHSRGVAGYRDAMRTELHESIAAFEERLVEGDTITVNDIFSPPTVRLVTLLARAGEWNRAKSWRLQACAARPLLRHWFATLPELLAAPGGAR